MVLRGNEASSARTVHEPIVGNARYPLVLKMFPAANEDQIKSVLDFLSDRLEETDTE